LTEDLVVAKTLLDAEELAERCSRGRSRTRLFLGLLRERPGDPRGRSTPSPERRRTLEKEGPA